MRGGIALKEAPGVSDTTGGINGPSGDLAARVGRLSPGQLDCLRLVDQHLSSKEIAESSGVPRPRAS